MKRYGLTETGALEVKVGQISLPIIKLEENENGNWCWYSDVAALESQLQQAQERVKELEDINESIRNWNACEEQDYKNLIAENAVLKHELQCVLERAKPHAKELPQDISHLRTNARDACTWIAHDIEGFLNTNPGDSMLKELEALKAELKEGDYWAERAKAYSENGGCLICFGTDEAGHKPGCEIAELEALRAVYEAAEELRKAQTEGFGRQDASSGLFIIEAAARLDDALAAMKGAD